MPEKKLLLELQQIDLDLIRLRKHFSELPEIAELEKVNKKLDEIFSKSQELSRMRDDAELEINRLSDSDDGLKSRGKELERAIKEESDFRNVQNLTRDLESVAKRRDKVEFESTNLLARLDKISLAEDQVASATNKLEAQKNTLESHIKKSQNQAKDELDALVKRRSEIIAKLPGELVEEYEALSKNKNGIAVCELENDHCSVCRVEFQKSKLSILKSNGSITRCPQCNRIMILRDED